MSGKKRILINNSDFQWLMERAEQLRYIRADLPDAIMSNLRRNAAELQERLAPLEQRQRDFVTAISGLSDDLRESETRTARQLEKQQRAWSTALEEASQQHARDLAGLHQDLADTEERLYDEIQATEQRLRLETLHLLAEQDAQLRSLIADERQARQQQVQNLQTQIHTLVSGLQTNEQRKIELAQTWVSNAQTILDFITGHYRCEQFAPGQLAKLQRELQDARRNLSSQAPEAALSTAQSACNGLSDLRLELERLEHEWQFWRSAALDATHQLLTEAARNRQVSGIDINGQPVDLDIEVDWWTEGKLTALQKDVEKEIIRLEEHPKLSTDELRKVVEATAQALRQRLGEVIAEARLAVVSSQMRYSIADLVVQALEEQGFDVQDGVYQGQDMRNGYYAKVAHPDGSEVVVSVSPDAKQAGQNLLEINSYDVGLVAEAELRQRAEEINRSLCSRNAALQISSPQPTGEPPNPEVRDLEKVRKQRKTQSVR